MDAAQLRTALKQLGVTPPDQLRASLYLQVLRDAKTFFSQTMALQPNVNVNGMGADYSFVKAAVTSSSLLTELAEILDLFLGPAIDRDMNLWQPANPFTYQQYFNGRILDPNDVTYAANVTAFYQRFPIAAGAVQAITNNFQQNILQACRRVVQDKAALASLYDGVYEWLTITGLKRIKSTGSDFHKGGKQVLILTFSIRYWIFGESMGAPLWGELKTVYKPSDIEADCLIIGNSAAVRNADPTFPITNSLTEIINGLIATEKRNNPQSTLETLPTYRILPRNYISQQPQPTVYPLPIRNAYGYIEHLDYETKVPGKIWSLFSYGASDFLIFPDQDEKQIVPQFYRRIGQLLAIACTFSLQDLHLQNVRVMSYLPYLIDLEICLVKPVNSAYETSLFGKVDGVEAGGITGETLAIEDQVWVWGDKPRAQLDPFFPPKTYQNRLYAMRPTRKVVPPSAFYIIRGFNRLMEILQTGVNNNSFDGWFTRLRGVLVRYTPYATTDFKKVREIIIMTTNGANNNAPLIPTIQTVLDNKVQDEFQKYQQARTPQPDFLAYQFAVSGTDFQNMDIPVFYHRIGAAGVANSLDLIDSQGRQVAIPVQININGLATNTNIGRATFFANLPTATTIRQGQLQVLSVDPGFTQRRTALRNTILRGLGRQGVPRRPDTLIP